MRIPLLGASAISMTSALLAVACAEARAPSPSYTLQSRGARPLSADLDVQRRTVFQDSVVMRFQGVAVCPIERVTVTERYDLDPALYRPDIAKIKDSWPDAASPEIAADPGRLAYFRERRLATDKMAEAEAAMWIFEQVDGCGQRRYYACRVGDANYRRWHMPNFSEGRCEDQDIEPAEGGIQGDAG